MTINLTAGKTAFVRMGWDEKGEKHPHFLEEWTKATVKDQAAIDAHFKKYQDAGIAILTGKEAGITVIDFDSKDNPLFQQIFQACPTYWVATKKGFHLYYQYIPELKQGTNRLGKGVDIRNDGGVVFAPPTKNYVGSEDEIEDINEDAKAILNTHYTPGSGKAPSDKELAATETRNDSLFRKACGWINVYDQQEVWNRMVKANKAFKKGELTDEELEQLFQQVVGYTPEKKESDFPIEELRLITVTDAKGKEHFVKCAENCNRLLANHPAFHDCFRFDEFTQQGKYRENAKDPWMPITDELYIDIQSKIQSLYPHFSTYGMELVINAVTWIGQQNRMDSAIEWIESLTWDGETRLESFCAKAYGVEDTLYHQIVGRDFWRGMASRILLPGKHHRFVMILEGEQNTKKSKSFRAIAGDEWFLEDAPIPSENVSFYMSLWGKLIVEFAEGVVFSKVDMGKLKGIVSTPQDTIVKKWGRAPSTIKRRCVFVITTNQSEYLTDRTGNTRFFPVKAVKIDLDYIEKNREQLFAEACYRIKQGEIWWDESDEAKKVIAEEQSARMASSVLEDNIERWVTDPANLVKTHKGFLLADVLRSVLDREPNRGEEMIAGAILREKGFVRDKNLRTVDDVRGRFWTSPALQNTEFGQYQNRSESTEHPQSKSPEDVHSATIAFDKIFDN